MKKYCIILLSFFSVKSFAQVTIGTDAENNSLGKTNPAVILDFNKTEKKGILLPWVESTTAVDNSANNLDGNGNPLQTLDGTLVFDTGTQKIKAKIDGNWVDYSGSDAPIIDTNNPNVLPSSLVEKPKARVIIGSSTSPAAGILVLESDHQAMVLPKVANYTDIVNPSAGMMVYVTTNKRLAFYNGKVWSFWRGY